ncbi:MAG: hypothetical protein H0T77_14045 [Pyrinomonadaceae bacterium]|nr:hypothetical protein [Pyrinomonadaceae bacterium]
MLTSGSRDLPARQQTLRGAIDWSYDFLNAAEQKLFRRLSVFVGGCTLEAVEAVCDTRSDLGLDLLDGMASMVDKSLIRQVEQAQREPRFVMQETIREYALEKLAASAEEGPTRRAHAGTASCWRKRAPPSELMSREVNGWIASRWNTIIFAPLSSCSSMATSFSLSTSSIAGLHPELLLCASLSPSVEPVPLKT